MYIDIHPSNHYKKTILLINLLNVLLYNIEFETFLKNKIQTETNRNQITKKRDEYQLMGKTNTNGKEYQLNVVLNH